MLLQNKSYLNWIELNWIGLLLSMRCLPSVRATAPDWWPSAPTCADSLVDRPPRPPCSDEPSPARSGSWRWKEECAYTGMMTEKGHRLLNHTRWRRCYDGDGSPSDGSLSDRDRAMLRCNSQKTSLRRRRVLEHRIITSLHRHCVLEHRIVTSLRRCRVWLRTRWCFSATIHRSLPCHTSVPHFRTRLPYSTSIPPIHIPIPYPISVPDFRTLHPYPSLVPHFRTPLPHPTSPPHFRTPPQLPASVSHLASFSCDSFLSVSYRSSCWLNFPSYVSMVSCRASSFYRSKHGQINIPYHTIPIYHNIPDRGVWLHVKQHGRSVTDYFEVSVLHYNKTIR